MATGAVALQLAGFGRARLPAARPLVVRQPVADGEELPLRIVEEPEVHGIEQRDGSSRHLKISRKSSNCVSII